MASAAGRSEEEKTLIDLQERLLMSTQTLNRLNQQERIALNQKARTDLTLAELTALPDNTQMYKSVGKAYFLSTKSDLIAESHTLAAAATQEAESLRSQRAIVEQKMKEAETELKELVQSNPAILQQMGGLRVA